MRPAFSARRWDDYLRPGWALSIVFCLIYINKRKKRRICQSLPQHFSFTFVLAGSVSDVADIVTTRIGPSFRSLTALPFAPTVTDRSGNWPRALPP